MSPTWNVPWPLALIYGLIWTILWMIRVTLVILAAIAVALYLIGLAGYRVGERIEQRRRGRLKEATTEVRR